MGGFLPPAERRSSALLGLYAAVALVLLVTGERLPQASLRSVGALIFAPLDRMVLAGDRLSAAWRENQRLHQRVSELEMENQRLRDAGLENQRLRQELGMPPLRDLPVRPVEVLAVSGEPIPSAATLGAGRNDGVHEGDAVVTSDGLVGRVSEAYPALSRVVLLTDPNAAIACEVDTVGVQGVLRFVTAPYPRLVLTGVPLADTVHTHQRVFTSGLSRRFPRGLLVGTITALGRDPSGLTQDIEVTAAARLSRLRHAFILPHPDTTGLGPTP